MNLFRSTLVVALLASQDPVQAASVRGSPLRGKTTLVEHPARATARALRDKGKQAMRMEMFRDVRRDSRAATRNGDNGIGDRSDNDFFLPPTGGNAKLPCFERANCLAEFNDSYCANKVNIRDTSVEDGTCLLVGECVTDADCSSHPDNIVICNNGSRATTCVPGASNSEDATCQCV